MPDDTGAHHAPDGRSRSILPAVAGGLATLPRAPGPDQPPVPPGQDRLCAAPRVPEHVRSHPAQRAPDQDATPADWAGVADADCLCATFAAAARPDCSPVRPPPPARAPAGHALAAGAPPASITQFTAPELIQLLAAAAAPPAGPSHPDHPAVSSACPPLADAPAAQLAAKENGLWTSPNYSSPCRSGGTYRGATAPTPALSL